jgi:hypothetical protein
MVTNWPVVAIAAGLGEPKNVIVTSTRNTPVRDSILYVEKKATAKEGINSFPTEDLFSVFCHNRFCLPDLITYSAVKLLSPQRNK